jgi:hypothetical protein
MARIQCSFCRGGRCDGIIYYSWTEMNNLYYEDYEQYDEDESRTRYLELYLLSLPIDRLKAISIHFCDGLNNGIVNYDNISIIVQKMIFELERIHKEMSEENMEDVQNNIFEDRKKSWDNVVNMVSQVDYKNYNDKEELFHEQQQYLLTLPMNVVRAIGIRYCNVRKNDDNSVIFEKIHFQLKCIYQEKAEDIMIEENLIEAEQNWNYVNNMVSSNDYMDYNEEEMFSQQYRYISTLPIDVVRVIGNRFCNASLIDNISDIIEKIHFKLINIFQERIQSSERIQERTQSSNNSSVPSVTTLIQPPKWVIHPLLICLETSNKIQEDVFCAICLESHKKMNILTTNCEHEFCKKCMCDYLDSDYLNKENRLPTCAMCRTIITTLETKDAELYDDLYERYTNKPPQKIVIEPNMDIVDIQEMIEFLDYYGFVSEV